MHTVDNNTLTYSQPHAGVALVAEGGGQRGAFTAGVLDSWQIANFNPFQVLIGTSAGAQNIASYMSKQTGYAYTLIANLTRHQSFFNPWRAFTKKNVMDLDWYFAKAASKFYQFDEHQAYLNSQGRKVRFSASNSSKFATELIDPNVQGWLEALKYSSAIPYLYKSDSLVDGGVTAPVPVHQAYELGAKTILTIRTTVEDRSPMPKPIKQLKPFICGKGKCPEFINLWTKHEHAYDEAESFIQQPPAGVKVIEIKPLQPLKTKVLGSSQQDIVADYKYGFALGRRFIENTDESLVIH
ncbi:patatin-like phospholipase family protein [Thalassotalea eurytherma]|uniref:PNPLA domain-containing protein n=1 Tax=Thalassotalea eurytherma TaxID=1144278 RepID=A0ABQ6H3Z8_9GAMM|nr:DUF6363 domain-containing protein [Thalassotalea eurytherma]GLX82893.1 hypothetical protein theurythT_23450 [Thalassotalea eurytherma]